MIFLPGKRTYPNQIEDDCFDSQRGWKRRRKRRRKRCDRGREARGHSGDEEEEHKEYL